MSDTTNTPEIPATENTTPSEVPQKTLRIKKPLVIPTKVQKKIESLQSKIEKLAADNKNLKTQLCEVKTSHTRIRRIPKVKSANGSESETQT